MGRKAILFDLFGTLVNTVSPAEYDRMLAAVAAAMDAPVDPFSAQWRAEIVIRESGGLGSVEELLASTAGRAGHSPTPEGVERAARAWLEIARGWLTPREHTVPTIRAFRDVGYLVGLVSNCSAEVPRLWPENPLSEVIDVPVFSCEAGVMKPDPVIYERACSLLEVLPEECVFVGDGGADELTGAEAFGMKAVLLRVPGEEHTWFDANYRRDALAWQGDVLGAIEDLAHWLPAAGLGGDERRPV